MPWKTLKNDCHDPAYNLALEQYLLEETDGDFVYFWRDERSVIVGRNQNTLAQINTGFTKKNNIVVVRRSSGGGAVFHDLGNINFTVIKNAEETLGCDMRDFLNPVIKVLRRCGIEAELSGRNDLVANGKKFSGNAQRAFNGRIMHHGTILYATDIQKMTSSLRVNSKKYEDRAIKSVASRVVNLSELFCEPMSSEAFLERMSEEVCREMGVRDEFLLSVADKLRIDRIALERYRSWEWNYGKSPRYNFARSTRLECGTYEVYLFVEKGVISEASIYGDFIAADDVAPLERVLIGCRHTKEDVEERLTGIALQRYIGSVTPREFAEICI